MFPWAGAGRVGVIHLLPSSKVPQPALEEMPKFPIQDPSGGTPSVCHHTSSYFRGIGAQYTTNAIQSFPPWNYYAVPFSRSNRSLHFHISTSTFNAPCSCAAPNVS